MDTFENLGLCSTLLNVVRQVGFDCPTPIQKLVIPEILGGTQDIIGQAQTGTGKTAAFGLPMIEQLESMDRHKHPRALVLTPTRELALQVCKELNLLKGPHQLAIIPIYGGASFGPQLRDLGRGADVVVGTPGRVLDLMGRGVLLLDQLRFMVVDEADEMLQMGFQDEIEAIFSKTPSERRTLLFSATMPPWVLKIADRYMNERKLIQAENCGDTANLTDQVFYEIRESDRFEALCRIIEVSPDFYGIVFCRTRMETAELAARMEARGHCAGALHGDFTQAQRESVLMRFRLRKLRILVATDVAARGIDIRELTHVVNYSIPQSPDAYIHRIGRTGRAGKTGQAVTLVGPTERYRFSFIQRVANVSPKKMLLPTVDEVIEIKKDQIRTRLAEAVSEGSDVPYREIANELLTWCEAEDLVAALLQESFKGELDRERYAEIVPYKSRNPKRSESYKNGTRLFVTRGLNDGLTKKRLVKIILRVCRTTQKSIHDLELGDRSGFVTLSKRNARILVDYYRSGRGKPLITRAKRSKEKTFNGHRKSQHHSFRKDD